MRKTKRTHTEVTETALLSLLRAGAGAAAAMHGTLRISTGEDAGHHLCETAARLQAMAKTAPDDAIRQVCAAAAGSLREAAAALDAVAREADEATVRAFAALGELALADANVLPF